MKSVQVAKVQTLFTDIEQQILVKNTQLKVKVLIEPIDSNKSERTGSEKHSKKESKKQDLVLY